MIGWCGAFPPPIRMCFFFCKHLLLADTSVREACFYRLSLHQTHRKRDSNVTKKACRTLFIISPVFLGLSTQFKNWYTVWRLLQHISWTKTHWGSDSLLRHLKLVMWFWRAGPSIDVRGLHKYNFNLTTSEQTKLCTPLVISGQVPRLGTTGLTDGVLVL